MKESVKTLIFLAIAALSVLLSFTLAPEQNNTEFNDVGQAFFPNYTNPLEAHSLEITSFNAKTASSETFSVSLKNGRWTLPSHFNYPTDAGPRMEKLAAKLIGLKRDEIRTRISADHQSLAVIDPEDTTVSALTGRGQKVVLKDKNGNVLCQYIIGDKVPNREAKFNFIRLPKQNIVYAVRNDAELTTSFDDWVQTNLLQIDAKDLKSLLVNNYSLTEGKIKAGVSYTLDRTRKGWKGTQSANSASEKDKELNLKQDAVQAMCETFAELKLIGVSPKPLAFAQKLKDNSDGNIDAVTIKSLKEKGYHLGQQGLLSDEGETIITTLDGIVYSLRFGDAFIPENAVDKKESSRYLLLTVEHNPEAAPAPQKFPKPADIGKDPSKEVIKKYEDEMNRHLQSEEIYKRWESSQVQAKAKVQALQTRFADWYFIIDNQSFKNAKKPLAELVK